MAQCYFFFMLPVCQGAPLRNRHERLARRIGCPKGPELEVTQYASLQMLPYNGTRMAEASPRYSSGPEEDEPDDA